jgi:DDE superfamily endonuclease
MEDVLAVYMRPCDERRPLICMDEGNKSVQAQTHEPVPAKPGTVEREDYEYVREGTCNLFVAVEPLVGKRIIGARARRTKADWAYFMRDLLEVHNPQADKVVLEMAHRNTHSPASFYEVFEPQEAWRLSQKLEIHHTPVHGSWLNMAEIEPSVLARQALSGRLPTLEAVQERVAAWQERCKRSLPGG